MKKFFICVILSLTIIGVIEAQNGFSYQSIVRNSNGLPSPNTDVRLQFKILQGSSTGPIVFQERQEIRTDEYGWFNVTIGNGTLISGDINSIDWHSNSMFLRVECLTGAEYREIATTRVNNSPFIGAKGDKGDTGSTGPKGDKGDTGSIGPKGDKGDTGSIGPKGDKGDTGSIGPKGDKGDTGSIGPKGDKGDKGDPASLTLPYAASASTTGTNSIFNITQTGNGGPGITGIYGQIAIGGGIPLAGIFGSSNTGSGVSGSSSYGQGHAGVNGTGYNGSYGVQGIGIGSSTGGFFAASGTAHALLTGSGNVGIGTTNPTQKLDIDGQLRIRGGNPGVGRVLTSDMEGNASWETPSGGGLSLWNLVGSALENSNNNITQNPLRIFGTSGLYISLYEDNNYLGYIGSYSGSMQDVDFGTGGDNTTGKTHLVTQATPKLTVDANGKVGIGTQDPTEKLHVAGNVRIEGEVNKNSSGSANLIPIAYGSINGDGTINSAGSTSNFTINKNGIGLYDITINGEAYNFATYTTSCTLIGVGAGFVVQTSSGTALRINTSNVFGNATDRSFTFVVYKP